jgi:glutathione S-transferase
MMSRPIVHGIAGSPFVNAVRLTLHEKGVDYVFAEMPFGVQAHKSPEHLARNPFGRIPVLEHDGFLLYETQAIMRYVDRAFAGPSLQPSDVRALARMDQILNINDWYVFPSLTFGIAFQRLIVPQMGGTPDEAKIAAALPQAKMCLSELERLMGDGAFLAGEALSLADLIIAPPFGYFVMTPESRELMKPHARLNAWWTRMSARDSLQRARPKAA